MNETDVKELFASVASNPAPDRIDLDAVLAGGRRRHRTRVAATLGVSLGALAVVGALVLSGLPRAATTLVGPSPTTAGTAVGAVLVTSADQIVGTWRLLDVGSGAGTVDPEAYPESTVVFHRDDLWAMDGGGCHPPRGTFTITSGGRFAAVKTGPNDLMACAELRPDIRRATSMTFAVEVATNRRTLTMLTASGEMLATWTEVLTDSTPTPAERVLDVSCSSDGISVSDDTVAAQETGVVIRVSSTLPKGSYLAYGYGGDELPAAPTTWTLRTPPGPLSISCRPGGEDPGPGDETTVTVTDPDAWWEPTTMAELGCTMGGMPSWVEGSSGSPASTPQDAIDSLVTAFQKLETSERLVTATRAPVGYPGYWPQTWIGSKDGAPSFTITLTRRGNQYQAYPDYICATP